jgi:hypothetical protein
MESIVPVELIEKKILLIRRQKVMLSMDLAELYGVEHRVLMQAIHRNIDRFPEDFMFQLSPREFTNLKSQFVTSSWGGMRKAPHAFTEHGALMAASVLNSKCAVEASVFIIRAFVRLREMISSHKALAEKLNELEKRLEGHDASITEIVKVIQYLAQPDGPLKKKKIGFIQDNE